MFVTDTLAPAVVLTRSSRLIGLVRGLIDYGKELIAILQAPRCETQHYRITRCFGTLNIDLIFSRIVRGLWLAVALEHRLVLGAARLDAPPRRAAAVASTVTAAAPRSKPPRASRKAKRVDDDDDDAALLAQMPTPAEIGAMVRGRPIGVVIAAICHDFGIDTSNPLWRELHEAILLNGGSLARMVRDLLKRGRLANSHPTDTVMVPAVPQRQSAAEPWPPFAAATGSP